MPRVEDADFMRSKIAVARFYASHILTRVPGLRDSILEGAISGIGLEGL